MNQIKVGICFLDINNEPIVTKNLKSNWSVEVENKKELTREVYRKKVKDEVAEILTNHIKAEITYDVIREMLEELDNL